MRILHCIPSLGGGGAERQLSYISAEMTKQGVDVHIVCNLRGPNADSIRESGVTIHELRGRGNHDPRLFSQLIGTIRKVKPDLIQTWLVQMDILGGLAAILTRTPFLMTERSVASAYDTGWKDDLRSWIGRRAAVIVANSEKGREYWSSRNELKRLEVVPNGVPLEQIKQSPALPSEQTGIGPATEVILFAGRYSPEKNVMMLLEALRQVLSARPHAVALLFGEGPLERELVEAVNRHGLGDRVKVKGYTPQLWSWMKRANVFVSVSLFEGSPNVVLEAAAQACPLVVSNVPGHRELLGEGSAFFVLPSCAADIAQGIIRALDDPGLARRKASAAYEIASGCSVESVTHAYLDLYRMALVQT